MKRKTERRLIEHLRYMRVKVLPFFPRFVRMIIMHARRTSRRVCVCGAGTQSNPINNLCKLSLAP